MLLYGTATCLVVVLVSWLSWLCVVTRRGAMAIRFREGQICRSTVSCKPKHPACKFDSSQTGRRDNFPVHFLRIDPKCGTYTWIFKYNEPKSDHEKIEGRTMANHRRLLLRYTGMPIIYTCSMRCCGYTCMVHDMHGLVCHLPVSTRGLLVGEP